VVQNSSGLLLDLDVVDDILPAEDGGLSLNDASVCLLVLAGTGLSAAVGALAFFGIALVLFLELLGDSASLEDEHFTLGLLRRDVF
jgi:hypothetical protein